MANEYCAPADLYAYGLPRGACPNPARLAGAVSVAGNTISLDGHGFATDSAVYFRAEAGGALPSPLVEGVAYYAIPVGDDAFRVASSAGGSAIDLTTAGSRLAVISPLPISSAIAWASRLIDDMLPAHVVPLSAPYPPIIVMTCAELAIRKLMGSTGAESKSLADMSDAAQKRLERWARGVPIRGVNKPASANLSVSAAAPATDSRGWRTYGGTQ